MQLPKELSQIVLPHKSSHKGQNGRLLIVGGSQLFHSASLWALIVASRIVDLVHYASTPENNQLVHDLKKEFRNGIVIPRADIESYIEEDDAILIGPGMTRDEETKFLTDQLLSKYPHKQWIIDAGALQMMDISLIPKNAVLTPHGREFEQLLLKTNRQQATDIRQENSLEESVKWFAEKCQCIVLVKGEMDIISDGKKVFKIPGGNAGMTKGGTGDVLAGLVAALATKSDPWASSVAGSFINKAAGEKLFKKVGYFFNASDLADEIPRVMKHIVIPAQAGI